MEFIPEKIKNKFLLNIDENTNYKKFEEKKKGIKDINNFNSNTSINNSINNNNLNISNINKFINNQKILNNQKIPDKDINNELISGQTFYKFFRKKDLLCADSS